MKYNEEELKKIQKKETLILKEVIRVCSENNIEYFVNGGTALGAVRHGGFIPWDDDIDIGMTRKNYEKFEKIAQENLPGNLFLQTSITDPKSPILYMKVRMNDTMFMEFPNRKLKMHHGIYIDIFPYDNVPNDDDEYIKWSSKIQKLIRIYVGRYNFGYGNLPKNISDYIKKWMCFIIRCVLKLIPRKYLINKINNMITKYNDIDTNAIACLYSPKPLVDYGTKETIFPLKQIKFENLEVNVPNDVDKFLKNNYGDYMKLPPKNERYGHKPFKIMFDTKDKI